MAQLGRANLKHEWYACLPAEGTARLSPLWHTPGVEVLAAEGSEIWVRGPALDDATRGTLRSVLGCQIQRPLGDGQLIPAGKAVPQGYEPQGAWRPLREWLSTVLPSRRFAIRSVSSIRIRLVRTARFEPAALMLIDRAAWLRYASTAPQARLDRLMFATSEQQTVVVGSPLPPITGEFYWMRDGVAAPVGFGWAPAVDAAVLRELFQLEEGDVALLLPSGARSVIRSDQFVGATHSAARLTEGADDAWT